MAMGAGSERCQVFLPRCGLIGARTLDCTTSSALDFHCLGEIKGGGGREFANEACVREAAFAFNAERHKRYASEHLGELRTIGPEVLFRDNDLPALSDVWHHRPTDAVTNATVCTLHASIVGV